MHVRKKFLLLKDLPGVRFSLWDSVVNRCKGWKLCSHFGTMKGARLGGELGLGRQIR